MKYCSSDFWSVNGTSDGFQFRGRPNLIAIMEDLIAYRGLVNSPSTAVFFTGSSAGGIGVLINANFVRDRYPVV